MLVYEPIVEDGAKEEKCRLCGTEDNLSGGYTITIIDYGTGRARHTNHTVYICGICKELVEKVSGQYWRD